MIYDIYYWLLCYKNTGSLFFMVHIRFKNCLLVFIKNMQNENTPKRNTIFFFKSGVFRLLQRNIGGFGRECRKRKLPAGIEVPDG
jgi:hypothetical protein